MLPRAAVRQATRLQSSSIASSSRLASRHLSSGLTRPSAVALGKRPEGLYSSSYGSSLGVRHFSWTPWTKSQPVPAPESVAESDLPIIEGSSASTQAPEPIFEPTAATSSIVSNPPAADPTPLASTSEVNPPVVEAASDASSHALDAAASATHSVRTVPDATLTEIITLNPEIPLNELLRTPEAIAATCHKADIITLGMDHRWFNPAGWARDALVTLHEYTHLPWWATIAVLTFVIRLGFFPMTVGGMKTAAKLKTVGPQMKALTGKMQESLKAGKQVEAQMYQQALQNLVREHNVGPGALLKRPLFQFPFFLSMFYGIGKLAETPLPGFLEGGFSWVTDLTVCDPYCILPLSSVILTNLVLRVGADGQAAAAETTEVSKHMKNIVAWLSIPMFFFIWKYPAALLFYWTTTNAFTLLQAFILNRSFVKRHLDLPQPAVPEIPAHLAKKLNENPGMWQTAKWGFRSLTEKYESLQAEAMKQAEARAAREDARMREGAVSGAQKMKREVIKEKRR